MKTAFFVARQAALSTFLIAFSFLAFAQKGHETGNYSDHFSEYDVVHIEKGYSAYGSMYRLSFHAAGRDIVLTVSPYDLRSAGYKAEDTGPSGAREIGPLPLITFKGKIEDVPSSEVRLTMDEGRIEGFFDSENERFFIEPAGRYSSNARSDEFVIYRAEDVRHKEDFWCNSEMPARIEYGRSMAESQNAQSIQVYRRLDVATEADSQFVSLHGGAAQANSEILSILNMAEGTFTSEVNLMIRVTFQHTWTGSDPFSGANPDQLLRSFQNHWNSNYSGVPRNTAHLFTGKQVAQSQGYAFFSVVCSNPGFAYGLSGFVGWAPGKYLVTAHELAHNLGAGHADAPQGCSNTLMNAQLSGSTPLTFCGFSRNEIGNYVAGPGSCLATVSTARTAFDFDGDGRADMGVFRPSNGVWYLNRSSSGYSSFQFGMNGDRSVAADYDGDGKTDAAIFRNGAWWRVRSTTNTIDVVSFGLAGDIPAPADFDGDGKADVAVFRPSTGTWYWLNSTNGSFGALQFGAQEDIPVVADFDGDGRADISLFRPSNGVWYRINSSNISVVVVQFGLSGDIPVVANMDGDSRADIAVWRPSNGTWYWLRSSDGGFGAVAFGMAGDIPAPADFDGDGRTDVTVYRPSNGVWYRLNSSNGASSAFQFGLLGDAPVQSYSIP